MERNGLSNLCGRLTLWLGFRCHVTHANCAACRQGTDKGTLTELARQHLRSRLKCGYLPEVQKVNPFNLDKAFMQYAILTDKPAQAKLLAEMLDFQLTHKGLEFEQIVRPIQALANRHRIPFKFNHKRAYRVWQTTQNGGEIAPCIHESNTIRKEQHTCCGTVRVFLCPKLKQEVWHTKCRTCSDYEAALPDCRFRGEAAGGRAACPFKDTGASPADCHACHVPKIRAPVAPDNGPLLVWATRANYRERHTTFFIKPFAEASWRVEYVRMDGGKPMLGLPEQIERIGVPDAVVQWEEHGVVHAHRQWRDFLAWCYDRGIVPLQIDFGYFGHYQHFMLDRYERNGYSSIHAEWDDIPDGPIDWDSQPHTIQDYRRRVLRGYAEARQKPPLVEGDYVAFWLQQYSVLSRLHPRCHNNALVAKVADECRRRGLKLAVKTAPQTPADRALTKWPGDTAVFRHEEVPCDTNQRLAVHARYCLVVSSSITNEFLLTGLPVVALGRSWYQGHGVFFEPEGWEDFPSDAPGIDERARNKYARWWLSRQFSSDRAGPYLTRIVERAKTAGRDARTPGTAITCVYAPDDRVESVARASVEATADSLSGWRRIVAIDDASPSFTVDALNGGAEVIALRGGEPPRMGELLGMAVGRARGEFVFTVEHDVFLNRLQAARAVQLMRRLPNRVACLYLQSVDEAGAPAYPWANDWPHAAPWGDDAHYRRPAWPTLSCTLWRTRALKLIDWDRVPDLEFVDGEIGNQLRRMGYVLLMADLAKCMHLPHTGRKSAGGAARTLAIGCDRNIWGRRGLRFGWNGAAGLDVRGSVPGALPFDADSFREIYVCGALDGLDRGQLETFVAEARRVLRDGGRLDLSARCACIRPLLRRGFRIERDAPNRIIAWVEKPQS